MKGSLALLVAVVLALGTIGVGYAVWTDSIRVHGNVQTGILDWYFSDFGVNSAGSATITPSALPTDDLTITVTNTYPGWDGIMTFREKNMGTLPLRFDSFQIVVDSQDDSLWDYYTLAFYDPNGIINYGPYTLHQLHDAGPKSYDALFGVDARPYFTVPVGGTHDSKIKLSLDSSLVGNYNSNIKFKFIHTATTALP
jgi:hypothetical protein